MPFWGVKYRTKESTLVGLIRFVLFIVSMILLGRTYQYL